MTKLKLVVCGLFAVSLAAIVIYRTATVAGQVRGSDLTAPTGLTATDSRYNNRVGLHWDAIRGATTYRLFRNTVNDPATATDIGSTVQNIFFDTAVAAGQTTFYWVRAETALTQSPMSASDQGTRAVGNNQGPVPPLQPPPPAPPDNLVTAAKTYLGKVLFWDEQLSSTRTVSCGTCHIANSGGVDPRSAVTPTDHTNPGIDGLLGTPDDVRGSAGVPVNDIDGTYFWVATYGLNDQVTGRRSVPFLNAAYPPELFWDGRATGVFRDPITSNILLNGGAALESQAAGPPLSTAEMAHGGRDWSNVAQRVAASQPLALSPTIPVALNSWIDGRTYPDLFLEAFGTTEVSPARIIMAIATYERILYTDQTPFDLDVAGIQPLSAAANRGRGVFNASNCNVCHAGNLFTDNTYRYIGVRPQNDDTGRFQVTANNGDRGSFRVPGLRNVAQRGTFFHNGQFTTLNQVVAFYNRGGDFNAPNKPTNLIRNLGLNGGQQADLVTFLQSLSDPRATAQSERFDRPVLYMESSRVPQITGAGRAGSGGFTPQIKAISPPLVGNPNFTISVSSALGNAAGVLVVSENDPGVGTTVPATGSFARVSTNMQNTGNGNGWASLSLAIPDNASIVGKTFFARWYVTDPAAVNGFSVSQAARFTVFGEASVPSRAKYVDFDGDGRTDVSVFRPSDGNWYIHRSGDNGMTAMNFGIATDRIRPGDYDGDGKTDIAVNRDGTWFLMKSRDGFAAVSFGIAGDIPQVGDYDGDAIDDVAVFRPSDATWYMQKSSGGFATLPFGISTDKAVAADFDGDGKTDPAVFRNGDWWIAKSTGGTQTVNFGLGTDRPVVGDYDADGKVDIAVWRPSTGIWFYIRSSDGGVGSANFGISTDIPTPGDYDGDGRSDLAIYRPSEGRWYLLNSTSGFRSEAFGLSTDQPIPSGIVP